MMGGPGTSDPTHITWANPTLKNVLQVAFDIKPYQVTAPGWFDTERYDFAVSVPEGATRPQVAAMWQKLLAERFGLVVHHESKEFQVDELVVGRGGHKLKQSAQTTAVEGPPKVENGKLVGPGMIFMLRSGPNGVTAQLMAIGQGLTGMVSQLSVQLGHPVIDKTGLTGKYDFEVEFAPVTPAGFAAPAPAPGGLTPADPSLNLGAAVQQQLGLRLEKGKAMLDVIVVDNAEKVPTEN
jgi:uncharacterized protein (TIGR03435 family)